MRLTPLLAAGLAAAGLPAIFRRLQQRHRWEQHNRQVYLSLIFEQTSAAATRAGLPHWDFLHDCRHHGATHIALLEDTLDTLLARGDLIHLPGSQPGQHTFASNRSGLIPRLQTEFHHRFPHLLAQTGPELVLQGDLSALRSLGLGFDPETFHFARSTGLQLIARPVSYPWPTVATIERTLAQAAALDASIIAFAHDPLLGHEMQLAATAASLRRHNLITAYFPDSRHQRGDWFLAKTAPERALLAFRYTAPELDREDEASLAYRAALRVREGGIRLIFVDANIGVHATTPTAVLRYLDELVHALVHHENFSIDIPDHQHESEQQRIEGHGHTHEHGHEHPHEAPAHHLPDPLPLAVFTAKAAAFLEQPLVDAPPTAGSPTELLVPLLGLSLLAADRLLPLPFPAALTLVGLGYTLAANLLPRLDRPRDALEHTYTPSYIPKLLALAALTTGPAAGPTAWLAAPTAGMLAAAAASDPTYHLRIETLRLAHLDWALPLALQLVAEPPPLLAGKKRWIAATALLATPALLRSRLPADPLDVLDREHPAGHTHHLSAAQRTLGDARLALSPQPLRKWSSLALLWLFHGRLPAGSNARTLTGLVATAGAIATAATLRQPSRPIALSLAQVARGWLIGYRLIGYRLIR